jgi:uncharacterized protein (DUF305 family)
MPKEVMLVHVMRVFPVRFSQRLLWLLLAPALALVVSLAIMTPASASGPAPDKTVALFEGGFLVNMIDHHTMAVEMGEMCVEKATHEDLRDLCEEIIETQSEESETMQGWLEGWYSVSYEPQMSPGEIRQMERLASLSGSEFEIKFMQDMAQHHKIAIQNAERCVNRTYHDDLMNLCEGIIGTQESEIEEMRTWLCEWYDRCRGKKVE